MDDELDPARVITALCNRIAIGRLDIVLGDKIANSLPSRFSLAGIDVDRSMWCLVDSVKFLAWAQESGLWNPEQLKVMEAHLTLRLMTD